MDVQVLAYFLLTKLIKNGNKVVNLFGNRPSIASIGVGNIANTTFFEICSWWNQAVLFACLRKMTRVNKMQMILSIL